MKVRLRHLVLLFLLISLLHFLFAKQQWYRFYGLDLALHFLGGIGFALGWLWLNDLLQRKVDYFSVIMFALFGSFIWELYEFSVSSLLPKLAQTAAWYSPSVSDVLSDMFAGLIGGIVVSAILKLKS